MSPNKTNPINHTPPPPRPIWTAVAGRPVAPRSDGLFAAAAAVAFCLFPADTTQAFLTHMFLQFSLFLMLLSLHAYLAGHEWVARALAAATLVCYESVYLLSLPAPMLDPGWNRGRWHRAARHVTWSLAVAGVYGALRAVLRESRVAELDAGTAVWAAVWNTLTGPVYALGMYGVRAVDAVRALDGELALWCVAGAAILWWVLARAEAGDAPLGALVWRGLLLTALAYPLAVILSSADVTGRSSRVHMAAGPGAAMVVGAACTWLLRRRRAVLAPAIALGLSLLVGFGHMVQHGYRASWDEQKALWRSVDTLCRDISDGTVLILDAGARTEPERFIEPVGWSVGIAMRKVFEFPAAWREAPLAERAQNLWVDEGRLAVKVQQDGTSHVLPARNTILLEYRAGQWERRAGVFEWGGAAVELKPAPSAELPPLRRGLLYGEVFGR